MADIFTLLAQSDSSANAAGGLAVIFGSVLYLGFIACIYVVMAVALMTIAKKTNTENEWWAWVPILNILLMLQIAELPMWYIVLFFVPCVNAGVGIYAWWKICERRGKPGALAIGMLIPVVNFVIPLYVAFAE